MKGIRFNPAARTLQAWKQDAVSLITSINLSDIRLANYIFISLQRDWLGQEYPAIYSVKYLFFSNVYLAGIFTEQNR